MSKPAPKLPDLFDTTPQPTPKPGPKDIHDEEPELIGLPCVFYGVFPGRDNDGVGCE